jgi:hypothetical protein
LIEAVVQRNAVVFACFPYYSTLMIISGNPGYSGNSEWKHTGQNKNLERNS